NKAMGVVCPFVTTPPRLQWQLHAKCTLVVWPQRRPRQKRDQGGCAYLCLNDDRAGPEETEMPLRRALGNDYGAKQFRSPHDIAEDAHYKVKVIANINGG